MSRDRDGRGGVVVNEEASKNCGGTSGGTPIRQPSPSSNSVGSSGGGSGSGGNQPTLDKKSLQLALLSLISDERFLDLLHAKYLMVHHARSNRGGGNPGAGGSS
mmetsp:Transcript_11455/g.27359  ORF Transcript_11455/g.27359 Transcript_11455/m.27359 type:complete len:104 (-) Transcript_11455:150-461(-)